MRGRGTSWLGTQSLGGQRLPGKKGAVVGVACGRVSRREEGRQCPGGGMGVDAEQGRPGLTGTGGGKCRRLFFKVPMSRTRERLGRSSG